jgi:hypothetical protein
LRANEPSTVADLQSEIKTFNAQTADEGTFWSNPLKPNHL